MRIWAFPSFYPFNHPGLRWHGIFAHRQYKGLIENGAQLSVIRPVLWSPPYPFSNMHPEWKRLHSINYPQVDTYDGVPVFYPRISNMRPNRLVRKSYTERYIDAIVNFFSERKIKPGATTDIFYAQWLPDAVFVQEAAHRLGLKSVILSIGDDVVVWPNEKAGNKAKFIRLMEEADHRCACADYLGKKANEIIGENLPYDVINWGVDYKHFKPVSNNEKTALKEKYNFPLDKTIILNVGSAIVRKGWLDLFDALAQIKPGYDNFTLVAVHAGFNDLDLTAEAEKRGLGKHFINLGEIEPSRLHEIFNAADIFCLPSHWEGLANANIEAMSSGLPVITTNVCGHPELVKDGYNGLLTEPKNVSQLRDKLVLLLKDTELKDRISKNGRDFIVNEWGDFTYNGKKLLRILEATAAGQ